jgi:hypothetical protein
MAVALEFLKLPVDPDLGLPQRFSLAVGADHYQVTLYANLPSRHAEPLDHVHDLAPAGRIDAPQSPIGFLVLRIDRLGPAAKTILLRKVVPDPWLVHPADELAVSVRRARIARGNLNGAGRLGSAIDIGVARRWV